VLRHDSERPGIVSDLPVLVHGNRNDATADFECALAHDQVRTLGGSP
jgi:hypothetical protein